MRTHIKTITDGTIVEFDKGKFDDWCVYITRSFVGRYAPSDIEYFSILKKLSLLHGRQKIYSDFLEIYNKTTNSIDEIILTEISAIAVSYLTDKTIIDAWFTVIYASMIAEENKKFTKLGKRIKRLGMYQLLLENQTAENAASFSKGKKWNELDLIMRKLNF